MTQADDNSILIPFFSPLYHQDKSSAEQLMPKIYTVIRSKLMAQFNDQQAACLTAACPDHQAIPPGWTDTNLAGLQIELGLIRHLMHKDNQLIGNALVQLLLMKVKLGLKMEFSQPTEVGSRFYFADIPIPSGKYLCLKFETDERLKIDNGTEIFEFCRIGQRWTTTKPGLLIKYINGVCCLGGELTDPVLPPMECVPLSSGSFDHACGLVSQAMAFLDSTSPEYSSWVKRVLRQVHIVGQRPGNLTLGSSNKLRTGMILLSHPCKVLEYADSMVHECTHQYYFLACYLSDILREGTENVTFYSTLVKQDRTINMVLLGYHVLANLLLFYDLLLQRGQIEPEEVRYRMQVVGSFCVQGHEILVKNQHLLSDNANQMWLVAREDIEHLFEKYSLRYLGNISNSFNAPA